MTTSGRTRILAAAGSALALTLTGPAFAGGTARAATTSRPDVGECRSLTVAQADAKSDTSAPIDCANAHNSRVIAVRNLPQGVTYADLHRDPDGALDRIVDRFHQVADKADAVVVVGSDYTDVGAPTEFSFNAKIAANLGSPVLLVLNAHDRTPDEVRARTIAAFDTWTGLQTDR